MPRPAEAGAALTAIAIALPTRPRARTALARRAKEFDATEFTPRIAAVAFLVSSSFRRARGACSVLPANRVLDARHLRRVLRARLPNRLRDRNRVGGAHAARPRADARASSGAVRATVRHGRPAPRRPARVRARPRSGRSQPFEAGEFLARRRSGARPRRGWAAPAEAEEFAHLRAGSACPVHLRLREYGSTRPSRSGCLTLEPPAL